MLRFGHRGFPSAAPANTMRSFRAAHAHGCDWVECDCRLSLDGIVVLAHDDSVTDRAGRRWVLAEHRADHLSGLDLGAGEGVPTLTELVAWADGRVGVMADVKREGAEREIGAALTPLSKDRAIVAGAEIAGRRRFRQLFPDLPLSATFGASAMPKIDALLAEAGTDAVTLEYPLVTSERVSLLHGRGICVYVWTVDDVAAMRELVGCGVDGIITNRADLLAQV